MTTHPPTPRNEDHETPTVEAAAAYERMRSPYEPRVIVGRDGFEVTRDDWQDS